jgi:TPR repeat protein
MTTLPWLCNLHARQLGHSRHSLQLALVLVLLCTSSVHASFEDGVKAAKLRQYDEAFELLLPEAQAGNAAAQLYIANMYRRGYGVKRELPAAALWYHRAAEQGEPSGMYNYGVHLRDGVGVETDHAAATQWFEKAARKGHPGAMLNLGLRLFSGKGIERNRLLGYAWVHKAAGKGSVPAIRRRRSLEGDLDTDQIRRARKMARDL